jgi:hypothetical protein
MGIFRKVIPLALFQSFHSNQIDHSLACLLLLAGYAAASTEAVWLKAWRMLQGAVDGEDPLKLDEALLNGSFARAKKGGSAVGETKRGKRTKWTVQESVKVFRWEFGRKVPPLEKSRLRTPCSPKSASPGQGATPCQKPNRVIADLGYDSDPLRQRW